MIAKRLTPEVIGRRFIQTEEKEKWFLYREAALSASCDYHV
jgi:hypothetical protein